IDDVLGHLHLAHFRALHALGKGGDGVDAAFDLIQNLVDVVFGADLQHHVAGALPRHRTHAVDASESLQRFLDADDNGLLHLLRRSAGIGHVDLDRPRLEFGKDLHLDSQRRGQTREDDQHHQQVGCHAVGAEPGDDALLLGMRCHGVAPAITSSMGLTCMPSMGTGTGETMTLSPALRPRSTYTCSASLRRILISRWRSRCSPSMIITWLPLRTALVGTLKMSRAVMPCRVALTKLPMASTGRLLLPRRP